MLAFFSASAGKRDMYILPALPAFALAAAPALPALLEREGFRRLLWAFVLMLSLLLLALGVAGSFTEAKFATRLVHERGLGEEARALWWMLLGVGAIASVAALWLRPARALAATAVLLFAVWSGYGLVAHPVLDGSSSSRALMQQARALAGPTPSIGLVDWKEQNLLQAVGPTAEFGFRASREEQLRRAVVWLRAAPAQRRLLVQEADAGEPDCLRLDAAHAQRVGVANRRVWWLAGDAALTSCP